MADRWLKGEVQRIKTLTISLLQPRLISPLWDMVIKRVFTFLRYKHKLHYSYKRLLPFYLSAVSYRADFFPLQTRPHDGGWPFGIFVTLTGLVAVLVSSFTTSILFYSILILLMVVYFILLLYVI